MTDTTPLISVIIATYNWSSVLRYSIPTALWQTFRDFELLVIGDGCTDDSEQVVASFDDPRIHWHNLRENSGSQTGPNNRGIELARGKYIAHLGHDDLWHPRHLELLVTAMQESDADFAYTLCDLIFPPPTTGRMIAGLTLSKRYEPYTTVPPSSCMYKREAALEIGGWQDRLKTRLAVDMDFITRLWEQKKQFVPVYDLTVFKFPSMWRKDVYIEKPSHEQAEFFAQLTNDPELRYKELLSLITTPEHVARLYDFKTRVTAEMSPGYLMQYYRFLRGVATEQDVQAVMPERNYNLGILLSLNVRDDVTPLMHRFQLISHEELLTDGLFLGFGWYEREQNEWGLRFRWARIAPELVIGKPTGTRRRLRLEVMPGPALNGKPFQLCFRNQHSGGVVQVPIDFHKTYGVEFPSNLLEPNQEGNAVLSLYAEVDGEILVDERQDHAFALLNLRWLEEEHTDIARKLYDLEAQNWHLNNERENWFGQGQLQLGAVQQEAKTLRDQIEAQSAENERLLHQAASQSQTIMGLTEQVAAAQSETQNLREQMMTQSAEQSALANTVRQLDTFRATSLRYWLYRVRTSPKLRRLLGRG